MPTRSFKAEHPCDRYVSIKKELQKRGSVQMKDQLRIITGSPARLDDITACSRALLLILLLIICGSSIGWAQGPGLPRKTCSDGRQRYMCQGDLVVASA